MKSTRFFLAVGITFAIALTISCSGDDGADGIDGTGCRVQEDGVEYVMKCGDEEARWAKAWCGAEAYDPKKNICYNDILGVKIGEQIWMIKDYVAKDTDGKYDWATASTICPIGWTLPSKVDFEGLISGLRTAADLVNRGFPAEANKQWWSEAKSNVDAYYLRIDADGYISNVNDINYDDKNNLKFVCCVRK